MRRGSITRFAVAIAALLLSVQASHASSVRICNKSNHAISIALAYMDLTTKFTAKGWWAAAPGACTPDLYRGEQLSYYVHFMKPGLTPVSLTGQSALLCVLNVKFEDQFGKHLRPDKTLDCASAGLIARKFTRIDTRNAGRHSIDYLADGTISHAASTIASDTPNACKRFPNLC